MANHAIVMPVVDSGARNRGLVGNQSPLRWQPCFQDCRCLCPSLHKGSSAAEWMIILVLDWDLMVFGAHSGPVLTLSQSELGNGMIIPDHRCRRSWAIPITGSNQRFQSTVDAWIWVCIKKPAPWWSGQQAEPLVVDRLRAATWRVVDQHPGHRSVRGQLTGVTLATRPPWRWIICWVSSILSKVTKRTVLLRLCRR